MRWTDLPAPSPVQALATWRGDGRLGAAMPDASVASIVARAHASGPLVLLAEQALAVALAHLRAGSLERGGLLVGVPVAAGEGGRIAFVHVTGAVPAVDDDASALALRMEASVWSRASEALSAGEIVVGWFHSHPGLGAFFSETDRRTQADFFHHPFSLGWVVDPLRGEHAWFIGPAATSLPGVAVVVLPSPPAAS